MVRTYKDSDGDGIGDLRGATGKLDHLASLGVDCIWLAPIFPSPLKDDGYDVSDYLSVHPDLGTEADFRGFLQEAHARGMRVVLDLVLNHTSDEHPWFEASRDPSHPEHGTYRDWYVWSDDPRRYGGAGVIMADQRSNWAWDPRRGQYYWKRFKEGQPDLNWDDPEVERAMLGVVDHWLDMGVDGLRLDALPYLVEREGTSCESLPETLAIVGRLRRHVEGRYPGSQKVLLAEANLSAEDLRPYLGDGGGGVTMAFDFPLMQRLHLGLVRGEAGPVREAVERMGRLPDGCQLLSFLRCHDELTLDKLSDGERREVLDAYTRAEPGVPGSPRDDRTAYGEMGVRRRLAPLLGNDRRRIELADSLLLTLPGAPLLYYGDEIGMGDSYRSDMAAFLDDRNGVRTPMQWSGSEANGGFSNAPGSALVRRPVDDDVYGYRSVSVASQEADPDSLLSAVRRMVLARRGHECLSSGGLEFLECGSEGVLSYLRTGSSDVLVVNNLSPEPQRVSLDLSRYAGARPCDILSGGALPEVEDGECYELEVAPYGHLWLSLGQVNGRRAPANEVH